MVPKLVRVCGVWVSVKCVCVRVSMWVCAMVSLHTTRPARSDSVCWNVTMIIAMTFINSDHWRYYPMECNRPVGHGFLSLKKVYF